MGWISVIQFVGELQIFFFDAIFRVAIRILPSTYFLDSGDYFPKVEIRRHDCMHLMLRFTMWPRRHHTPAYFPCGSVCVFDVL